MFRTEISHIRGRFGIDHMGQLLSLGSCFAANTGKRLQDSKFDINVNPVGILFNPLSIFELIELSLGQKELSESSYLEREGFWFNYKFHSSIYANSKQELRSILDRHMTDIGKVLENCDTLVLTFGTAWVHRLQNNMLVANCHKVPSSQFKKSITAVDEINRAFDTCMEYLKEVNPEMKCLLTVSPVRHTREGLPDNNLSKSVLRLACEDIVSNHENVDYFPAYEIMLDDLRDYRFYEKDMIHPNEQAQDYIWTKFTEAYFDTGTLEFVKQWTEVTNALHHKPFHSESEQHQQFLRATIQKLENLKVKVDVTSEINQLKSQLI